MVPLWPSRPSPGRRAYPLVRLAMLLIAVAAFFASAATAADECVFSDGSKPQDKDRIAPCSWTRDGVDLNTCCVIGDICLTNGGCRRWNSKETDDDRFYIGACSSEVGLACTDVCSNRGEIVPLMPCPKGNNSYVCGGTGKCDEELGGTISMTATTSGGTVRDPLGTPIPPHSSGDTAAPFATDATTSTSKSHTPGSTATSSSPGQTAAPGTPGAVVPGAPSNGADNSNTTTGSTDPQPQDTNGTIPLAVGVSIGGAAIAAAFGIGFWMWRERKKREPARADTPPPTTMAAPFPVPADDSNNNNSYYGDPRNALRQEAFMRMHGY
ncbi:hypothetical protein MAPG_02760 [Magnaporthiopsis poae ATCC 64411]|uniref:Mid2 domain-containing protein n=1 Tax=Magnaporthiopsis poae (strain ATCC 64411 / 73-15) TaxID=644358 RepID=A0A0C4DS83_MAGP6|nr:hypothetical protein MAPG_02760 [Magnaporthiopsis poae ATCC 64411]